MAIIRTSKTDDPYARISRGLLQDHNLSYEARGLAAYLLSKPTDWEIEVADLIKQSPDGRDKVYRILKELSQFGYLQKRQARTDGGKLEQVEYVLFESPALTASGFAVYGLTASGKSDTTYKRKEQTKELTNERKDSKASASPSPRGASGLESKKSLEKKPMEPEKATHVNPLLNYLEAKIGKLPDRAAQAGALRWLLEAGYTPAQCQACLDDQLRNWSKGRVSWLSIKTHIGSWLATRNNEGGTYAQKPKTAATPTDPGKYARRQ